MFHQPMLFSIKNRSDLFRATYETGAVNEKNRTNKNPYSNYNREICNVMFEGFVKSAEIGYYLSQNNGTLSRLSCHNLCILATC